MTRLATSWGPRIGEAGRTTFRLWAPAQDSVALVPAVSQQPLAMAPVRDGWFELETDIVEFGAGYSFQLSDGRLVPDPASRAQVDTVHGPSRLLDPDAHKWQSLEWQGRPWEQAVVYELHTGTFTPDGTFDGIASKLDYLRELGVTAIEVMPVAQFGGQRGWGYDGVLLYCAHNAYGGGDALKRLVDAAHQRGLMVILDVVYNHFGPDGNYLSLYAPDFFHPGRSTPWGAAIAYEKKPVRDFFVENALYWLQEYRLDGLRLDAVNQIDDQAEVPMLEELGRRIRHAFPDRPIHLMTEDDRNIVRLHSHDGRGTPTLFTAEWNDDFHHAAHVLATGEVEGYYQDYTQPVAKIARALAEGFIYQGEPSPFWENAPRGEPSAAQPPTAFVDFLQNHDQIGNRAFGERLSILGSAEQIELLTAVLLLSPHIPLLFMGEEWGEGRPFCFFTDFQGDLAEAVREGRRSEFKKWSAFQAPALRAQIPDPNDPQTFAACVLDWTKLGDEPHKRRLELVRRLLEIRAKEISPRLSSIKGGAGHYRTFGDDGFEVRWKAGYSELLLRANFGDRPIDLGDSVKRDERVLYASKTLRSHGAVHAEVPPQSVSLTEREAAADGR